MQEMQAREELLPRNFKDVQKLFCRNINTSVITKVTESEDSYCIETKTGAGFCGIFKPVKVVPKVGQEVKLYLHRGCNVRGVDLDGQELFFKTDQDLETERQEEIKELEEEKSLRKKKFDKELSDSGSEFNKRLGVLPKVFKQRFKKFFRLGEDFWDLAWYELVACETAFKIAYACRSRHGVRKFCELSWEEQKEMVPGINDGLSGNMFSFACRIAYIYLRDSKNILRVHGALSPLVGSKPYIGR